MDVEYSYKWTNWIKDVLRCTKMHKFLKSLKMFQTRSRKLSFTKNVRRAIFTNVFLVFIGSLLPKLWNMARIMKHCQNSDQHSKICEKFISLLYLRHLPSLGSRCSFASSAAWARGARVCVFRQNSWGQSGCLGSAFLRLKRLQATLTLTQASLTRRHRGRTCLLIREHALMVKTQGSSRRKRFWP